MSKPYTYNNGTYNCNTYSNGYYVSSSCYPSSSTSFLERRTLGSLYMNLTAELYKDIQLFGSAQYNVYSAASDIGGFVGSTDGAFQFMFGVSGGF